MLQVVVAQGPGMGITPLDGNGTAVWKTVPSVAGEEVCACVCVCLLHTFNINSIIHFHPIARIPTLPHLDASLTPIRTHIYIMYAVFLFPDSYPW